MRVVSHTASNTEIVCALGMAQVLVGVDADSDHPPDVVAALPRLGRDLQLDVDEVRSLAPDAVLTSLTVPGHERIVEALGHTGLQVLVADPVSLDDVFADIRRIGALLDVATRAEALVSSMQAAMPQRPPADRGRVLVEWWPKPVIAAAKQSWINDIVARAGGVNVCAQHEGKSVTLTPDDATALAPDHVIMSWCGVAEANYRARHVLERPGWEQVPAVHNRTVHAITEAYLGRPGPRLVEGYRRLAALFDAA